MSRFHSTRRLLTGSLGAAALVGCGGDDVAAQQDVAAALDIATTDADLGPEDVAAPPADTTAPDDATPPADTTAGEDVAADDTQGTPALPAELSAAPGRTARVIYPPDLDPDGGPYPLALLLHGYGANGGIQDAYLDFSPRAADRGWIVVIPEGTVDNTGKQFWNATPSWCCDFNNSGVDDTTYLADLLKKARAELPVDQTRVFIVGHSNGAYMAHRLACTHADIINGVVAIAGGLPDSVAACAPSRPVALWQIHGTADTVVLYNGQTGVYPGSAEVADRWASYNGCSTDLPTVTPLAKDYDPAILGKETDIQTHVGCPAVAPVAFWTLNGSSHVPFFTGNFMVDVLGELESLPR